MTLRRADGPGKFEGELLVTELLYTATLDGGPDDEASDEFAGTWFGRLDGPLVQDYLADKLTDEEREFLSSQAGAILCEDTQGFVSASYYETKEALDADWNSIVSDLTPDDEESEGPTYHLPSGYVFEFTGSGEWDVRLGDEDMDIVLYTSDDSETYLGSTSIDGADCCVFRCSDGVIRAATAVSCQRKDSD